MTSSEYFICLSIIDCQFIPFHLAVFERYFEIFCFKNFITFRTDGIFNSRSITSLLIMILLPVIFHFISHGKNNKNSHWAVTNINDNRLRMTKKTAELIQLRRLSWSIFHSKPSSSENKMFWKKCYINKKIISLLKVW